MRTGDGRNGREISSRQLSKVLSVCHNSNEMFIEWWERFRGIDLWPETRAQIRRIDSWGIPEPAVGDPGLPPSPVNGRTTILRRMAIDYRSADGMAHSRNLWLLSYCSTLSALDAGDYFHLQYSPDNPKKVYLRERTQSAVQGTLICLVIILLVLWTKRLSG